MDDAVLNILLVEDHDDMAQVTGLILDSLGHRHERVSNVLEAERALSADRFDAILADYSLPDGTGLDLLRRFPSVPAVLLTGYDPLDLPPDAMRPARVIRTKPLSPEDLQAALGEALATEPDA